MFAYYPSDAVINDYFLIAGYVLLGLGSAVLVYEFLSKKLPRRDQSSSR